MRTPLVRFFFSTDPAPTEIYTLSLHDALPIGIAVTTARAGPAILAVPPTDIFVSTAPDRKSTRLNSSHITTSYAVFCLKKKNDSRRTHSSIDRCRHTGPQRFWPACGRHTATDA